MATPFSDVINTFILKVKAYKLMALLGDDREEIVLAYLNGARAKFYKKCKSDLLTLNEEGFEADLVLDEVDILAELMIVEWLTPQIYDDELLESRLNTKDFTEYSPAKLIEQIHAVYKESKKRAKYMINQYTYDHGNVRNLDDDTGRN